MLSNESYITSGCIISDHEVRKNGTILFEDKASGMPGFLTVCYQHFGFKYPKFHKMDNLAKLGWLAAELLLNEGELAGKYQPADMGVVLANKNSSLDTDLKYYETAKDIASPALFVYTLPNIVIGEICIRHNFKGENAFFIAEHFDAGFIRQYVSNLINSDILQACICGWVEVLGDSYKVALFLIEKKGSIAFTNENINKIYQLENG
ncbi:hypothetical protein BH11BAC4_BH11BAC4_12080 [soil metagenome]